MKNILPTAILLLLHLSLKAQFALVNSIDSLPQFESISQVKTADFNNDGLQDIIASVKHFPDDSMRLYINLGNDEYSRQTITTPITGTVEYFDIADINNDGWVDFAVITNNATKIAWYENTAGIFTARPLASGLDFTTQLLIKDFDRNGLPDILALQHVEIVLYLQHVPGTFEAGRVVHGGTEFYAIDANYYNRDSLPDIAVASGGFEVLLNTGNGNFVLQSQAGINEGNGNFIFRDTILKSSDNFETFGFADLDCDSDNDLYTTIQQLGRVVWVENRLEEGFTLPQNIHIQSGQLIRAITKADVNMDGKPDIVWGNRKLGSNTNINACPFCIVAFTSSSTGSLYQWEADTGNGFLPLQNDAFFDGVHTSQLQLNNPPTNWYGFKYRCVVDNMITVEEHVLIFRANWTGIFNTAWDNPVNWGCGILPDENTDVIIRADAPHFPQLNGAGICRSMHLFPGAAIVMKAPSNMMVTGK